MKKPTLPEMVDALIQSGMTGIQIAKVANCDPSTVSRILREKIEDPKYSIASAIEGLYSQLPENDAA